MTPGEFARRLQKYAAAYDGNAWRVAEFALAVKEADPPIAGWAQTFAQAFKRKRRWAEMLARVAEVAAELPDLRKMTYTKADLAARYIAAPNVNPSEVYAFVLALGDDVTYERLAAELRDAFGPADDSPDAMPRRWARVSAQLYSDAEALDHTDPRRAVVEQAAAILAGIGRKE